MSFIYAQIIFVFIAMAINVFFQLLRFRCLKGCGLLESEYFGFTSGAIAMVLSEIFVFLGGNCKTAELLSFTIVNSAIYLSFAFFYFTFLNLGETGRRIRILRELYEAGGGLSEQEILSRYGAKEIVLKRIARLENHGQIVFKNGRYYIIGRPLMLLFAKIMLLMKIVILGKRSEFEVD